jgi:hypothetical protein
MNKATFILTAGAVLATSGALADGPQRQVVPADMRPVAIQPVRIAPVIGFDDNGHPVPGEWQPYSPSQTDGHLGILYDGYEWAVDVCQNPPVGDHFPANGALSGGINPACTFGAGLTGACGSGDTTRWFYGATVTFSGHLMEVSDFAGGASDGTVQQVDFAWQQVLGTQNTTNCGGEFYSNCIIVVSAYGTATGDLMDFDNAVSIDRATLNNDFLGGVVLDFGTNVPTGAGYYFTNVDLIGGALEFPAVAGGAVEILGADLLDSDLTTLIPVQAIQVMSWGSKDTAVQGDEARLGYADAASQSCTEMDWNYTLTGDPNTTEGVDGDGSTLPGGACPGANLQWMVNLLGEPGSTGPLCMTTGAWTNNSSQSGTVANTCDSDDVRVTARRATFTPAAAALLRYDASTNFGGGSVSSILVSAEVSISNSTVTNVTGRVQIRNQVNGNYVNIGSAVLNATDLVISGNPTGNAADYIGTGGLIQLRVVFQQTSGGPNWDGRIDQLTVNVQ